MILTSWLNSLRNLLANPPSPAVRNVRRKDQKLPVTSVQRLEDKALLATISFDSLQRELTVSSAAGEADDLVIASNGSEILIQSATSANSFVLAGDAVGNSAFSMLSQVGTDDAVNIDTSMLPNGVEIFGVNLGDENDSLSAFDLSSALSGLSSFIVNAGDGDDLVSLSTQVPAVVLGGAGQDEIFGSDVGDVIAGGPDVDEITAGAGNDIIGSDDVPLFSISGPTPLVDPDPIVEGDSGTSVLEFTVSLTHPAVTTAQPVSVDVTTVDGSATVADGDFVANSQTLTFSPTETSQTFSVVINGDETAELNENFFVDLSNAVGAGILDPRAVGTITNDDSPIVSVNDVSIVEGDSGTQNAVFTVSLSEAPVEEVTVDFETVDGTATAGEDYSSDSGTLTFGAGVTQQTIPIPISGDTDIEPDETFFVRLSNPDGITIQPGDGVGTIENDDFPDLTISNVTVNEAAGTATLTLSLSAAGTSDIFVDYATAEGTAIAGQDYSAVSDTAEILTGATSGTITIPIIDDGLDEPGSDETFTVQLSNPVDVNLTNAGATVSIVDDDDPTVTVTVTPNAVAENQASTVSLTVSRNTPTDVALAVDVSSSLPAEIPSPGTISLAVGEASATAQVSLTDNDIVDGDRTVIFDPTASGFDSVPGTLTIFDDEVPELTLTIDETAISENGGTAVGTVRRNNGTSGNLNVDLNTDLSEATMPSRITILDGSDFATFDITAVDDTIDDGDQLITVRANANGFSERTASLTVTDDDLAQLSITNVRQFINEGGTTTGRVILNAIATADVEITISSSDETEATVESPITIQQGSDFADFEISAVSDGTIDGQQEVEIIATAAGVGSASETFFVMDVDRSELLLVFNDSSIDEDQGVTTGTISLERPLTEDLVVTLSAETEDSGTSLLVPPAVTLAAGETAIDFTALPMPGNQLTTSRTDVIAVTATTSGLLGDTSVLSDTAFVQVRNNVEPFGTMAQFANITVDDLVISEDGPATSLSVFRLGFFDSRYSLAVEAPEHVTFLNSETAANLRGHHANSVVATQNSLADGRRSSSIRVRRHDIDASIVGMETLVFDVLDDDPAISLTLDFQGNSSVVGETSPTGTGTVRRANGLQGPHRVNLFSHDTSELLVPAFVELPDGVDEVTFPVTIVDDGQTDGPQAVQITARIDEFEDTDATITVVDTDPLVFTNSGTTLSAIKGADSFTVRRSGTDGDLLLSIGSLPSSALLHDRLVVIPDGQDAIEISLFENWPEDLDATSQIFVKVGEGVSASNSDVTTFYDIESRHKHVSVNVDGQTVVIQSFFDGDQIRVLEDTSEVTVIGPVPSGYTVQSSAADVFEIAAGVGGLLRGTPFTESGPNVGATGNQTAVIQFVRESDGVVVASTDVAVVDTEYIQLSLDSDSVASGGSITGTITRIPTVDQPLSSPVDVFLLSSDSTIALPDAARISFAAGEAVKTFTINAGTVISDQTVDIQLRANNEVELKETITVSPLSGAALAVTATIDTVLAGAGDDIVYGTVLNDSLSGEAGNDLLIPGPGNDSVDGGDDDDTLLWQDGDGNDSFAGGDGNDAFEINTINGLLSDTTLSFSGGIGDDEVRARSGSGQNVSYLATDTGTPNSGQLLINGTNDLTLTFEGLTPITLSGAGGTLTVDASALPAVTTLELRDDAADTAGVGGNVITGDAGFETTFFNGYDNLTLIGGPGTETIDVTSVDVAGATPLSVIEVDGGADADTINIADITSNVDIFVHRLADDSVNIGSSWSGGTLVDDTVTPFPSGGIDRSFQAFSQPAAQLFIEGIAEFSVSGPSLPIAELNPGDTPANATFTVTGRHAANIDTSASVTFNTADGTAEAADNDYTPVAAQILTFTPVGSPSQDIDVPIGTDITVEADETFTGVISNASDASGSLTIPAGSEVATATIQNDDITTVTLVQSSTLLGAAGRLDEGTGGTTTAFDFDVILGAPVQGGFTLSFTTNDGTATAAATLPGGSTVGALDYVDNDGALDFSGAAETQVITVDVNHDNVVEADETFSVALGTFTLSNSLIDPLNVTIVGSPQSATIDNDDASSIGILPPSPASIDEGSTVGSQTPFAFTVTLDNPVQGGFDLDYATNDGTAVAGGSGVGSSDYADNDGTLSFSGAAGPQTITVLVNQDTVVESHEDFSVSLNAVTPLGTGVPGTQITLGAAANATIANDDEAQLIFRNLTLREDQPTDVVEVFVAEQVQGGFTVDFATAALGATELLKTESGDLTFVSGTLSFSDQGNELQSFSVSHVNDDIVELDEQFTVTLSNVMAPSVPPTDSVQSAAVLLPGTNPDFGIIVNDDLVITVDVSTDDATNTALTSDNAEDNDLTYTLREAILLSNAATGDQTINTSRLVAGAYIALDGATLPTIASSVTILGNVPESPDEMLRIIGNGQADSFERTVTTPGAFPLLNVGGDVSASISHVHFTRGGSTTAGGAVAATNGAGLVITNSMFSLNSAATGGAISAEFSTQPAQLDVAFVLDVTESMSAELADVQTNVDAIIAEITSLTSDYQLSLHVFRDETGPDTPDVVFSPNNANAFRAVLNGLSAVGGDDPEEPYDLALRDAVDQAGWRATAEKLIILVTDNVPSGDDDTNDAADDGRLLAAARDAEANDQFLVTVNAGGSSDAAAILSQAARDGNGRFLPDANNLSDQIRQQINGVFPRVQVSSSTFFFNQATDNGGAVSIEGGENHSLRNSTFYQNFASAGGAGAFSSGASVLIVDSTLADNVASSQGAALDIDSASTTNIENSIVALNNNVREVNLVSVGAATDISGPFTESGNNLISIDPLLSGLMDAGGPTLTLVPSNLLDGNSYRSGITESPALNRASRSSVSDDQRGLSDGGVRNDIGAVEVTATQSAPIRTTAVTITGSEARIDFTRREISGAGDTTAIGIVVTQISGSSNVTDVMVVDATGTDNPSQTLKPLSQGRVLIEVPLSSPIQPGGSGEVILSMGSGIYTVTVLGRNNDGIGSLGFTDPSNFSVDPPGNFVSGTQFAITSSASVSAPSVSAPVLAESPTSASAASMLDASLELLDPSNEFLNWGGQNEKWIRGKDKTWYAITPDGTVYQWDHSVWLSSGRTQFGPEVAKLSSVYYDDVTRLTSAVEVNPVQGQSTADVVLWLDEALDLSATDYSQFDGLRLNDRVANGDGEKWIKSNKGQWYYLLPDGGFYRWAGGSTGLEGTLIAQLPSQVYGNPQLLRNATGINLDYTYNIQLVNGKDFYNWGGEQERWVRAWSVPSEEGEPNVQWLFVKPDGSLHLWEGDRDLSTSRQFDSIGSEFYRSSRVGDGLENLHAQDEYFSDWQTLLDL